jgi:hypothetical protein
MAKSKLSLIDDMQEWTRWMMKLITLNRTQAGRVVINQMKRCLQECNRWIKNGRQNVSATFVAEQSLPVDANIPAASKSRANEAARATFDAWNKEIDVLLEDKEGLRVFPPPPIGFCTIACRKNKSPLGFCEHSFKKWYEASGDLEETLRAEMRRWHPDRFTKCAINIKEDMVANTTEMFLIIQELIESEEKKIKEERR